MEREFVLFQPAWPAIRPTLVERFLDRVAGTDIYWLSTILVELAALQKEMK